MSASSRITDLVHAKLLGRKIDIIGFVDAVLDLAAELGAISCCVAGERGLRFELENQEACEIELDSARSKLRMLCARLGVLCNETPGSAVSLYGGEGKIRVQPHNGTAQCGVDCLSIRFKNTSGEQEFTVTSITTAANASIS